MSKIYKLNYISNNEIKKIYIFTKYKTTETKNGIIDNLNNEIFNDNEWSNIRKNNISYEIIKCNIYNDDTIQIIKEKLLQYSKLNISSKELYFFASIKKRLNINAIYNEITQNELIELKYNKICDFLNNIRTDPYNFDKTCNNYISKKKSYNYDDLNDIDIDWNELHNISLPIGQKIIFKKNYPFNSNPYHNEIIDEVLKEESTNLLSTQNKYILFEFGNIVNNNINFCLADDIITYSKNKFSNEEYLLKMYFPLLYSRGKVKSSKDLEKKRNKLISDDKKRLKNNFKKYNDMIDLLYELEQDKSFVIDYITRGIKKLHFTLHPHSMIKLPLEIIFKIINSNDQMPLIKYNPGSRIENIYRLYTGDNYSTNGSKIPQLYIDFNNKKYQINKLSKELAKKKKVGYYIKDPRIYALCEFLENGNIEIKLEMLKIVDLKEIIEFLDTNINKLLLDKINNFLEQSGYKFTTFKGLYEDNVEINDIIYEININYNEKINLNKHISCLSSIFNVHKGEIKTSKDEINLTYKRVSSFIEMDSINAFLTICHRNNIGKIEIMENLQNNFSLSEEQSQKHLETWRRNVDLKQGTFENKTITIESNPGFDVIIKSNLQRGDGKFTQGTKIIIGNIDNINYIEKMKIFFDAALKIIFDDKNKLIKTKCKGKKLIKDIIQDEDLKNEQEKDILKFQQTVATSFVDESDDEDDDDDVLTLLFGAKEEEGENEDALNIDEDHKMGDIISELGKDKITNTLVNEDIELQTPPDFSDQEEEEEVEDKGGELGTPPSFSDDEDSPFPEMGGGGIDIDLEGLPLSGSKSIFREKRQKLEPRLFLKKPEGKFNAYSKGCPWQYRKQPVMLTSEEKKYIDDEDKKNNSSSYDEHITYGTGKTKNHYICPRFWCIRDDNNRSRSLTIDQVNKGVCGGWDSVIPEGAKKIPKNKRIFEFTDKLFHRSKSKTKNPLVYKQLYPGFMDKSKHPDGMCVPCCYEKPFVCKIPDDWKKIEIKGESRYVKKDWVYNKGTKKPVNKNKTRGDKPLTRSIQEGWYHIDDKEFKKKFTPEKECPGGIELENMYKPGGPNDDGPSFNRDADGNIDFDSIKDGKKHTRPIPKKGSSGLYKSCNQDVNKLEDKEITKKPGKKMKKKKYISDKGPLLESFPLQFNQTGFLPITLQKFLGYNSREICQKGNDLKNDKYCLLRHGINQPTEEKHQSFLACIAFLYNEKFYIEDIKEELIKNLTLDKFISVYNGTLVITFEKKENHEDKIDISKYSDNVIIKKIKEEKYLKKIILAYENFINYLRDKNTKINYNFLWDFICQPKSKNGLLFEKGINMFIFNSPSDDITDKIELICPKTDYSTTLFDKSIDTILLYSKNNYYEPLCQIKKIYGETKRIKTKIVKNKFFSMEKIRENTPELLEILTLIINENLKYCLGETSISKHIYKFKKNKPLYKLIELLTAKNYNIDNQILNLNNQVIAVIVEKNKRKIYVPVLPSSLNQDYSFIFSTNPNIYFKYEQTYDELMTLGSDAIPCKPKFKVISDEMIVGIITETNQFVPVEPIIKTNIVDDLKILKQESILSIDNYVLENNTKDEERNLIVKKIKLETNFYNMFRNSFKMFLSNKKNRNVKSTLIETLNDIKLSYMKKLELISKYIKDIMQKKINFITYKMNDLKNINELFKCFGLDKEDCSDKINCSFNSGSCSLLLPKENLLNNDDNSKNYFLRLADELIRFSKIRKYILTPRTFLSFENISYNLTNKEIILLEDVLLNKYFEDLIAIEFNEYITNKQVFETANPIEHIPIKTIFNINVDNKGDDSSCIYSPEISLKLMNWQKLKLKDLEIRHYKQSAFCTFEMLLGIINDSLKRKNKKETDIITIKKELFEEIKSLKNTQDENILYNMFKSSSLIKVKKITADVLNNDSQLETHISSANYFVTEIDIYLLLKKYKINSVLITNKHNSILPLNDKNYLSTVIDDKPTYIIVCNGMNTKPNKSFPNKAIDSSYGYPRYGLIYLNNNKMIQQKYIKDFIDEVGMLIPVEQFFTSFKSSNEKKVEESRRKGRERLKKHRIKLKKIKRKGGNKNVKKMRRTFVLP